MNTPRSSSVPDIDFARIRPYGQPASRANAFEELSSILIRRSIVSWPEDVTFYRFGNPDGGREGKGVLPNGDVWAWQAKYLTEFDDSAAGQVTKSVRRALELEPQLRRYYVALPIDLPAGDTQGERRQLKSAQTRWDEKCAEWRTLAQQKGLDVEFHFVGAHDLLTALTEPEHAGRARYWFNATILTPQDQRLHLNINIAKAGRRYTPKLHVDVDAVRSLDALGRTDKHARIWQEALAALRNSRMYPWRAPTGSEETFEAILRQCVESLSSAEAAIESMIVALRGVGNLPEISDPLRVAVDSLQAVDDVLQDGHLQDGRLYAGDAAVLYRNVADARAALWRGLDLLSDAGAFGAAQRGALLIAGRAGVGKTHLLCDAASKRLDADRPTIVVLGQDFDSRPLLQQIGELAQVDGRLDELLQLLDAAGEAANCISMLIIDAINESERSERWSNDLRALIEMVDRYDHLALAVSCRSEFLRPVVGDDLTLPVITHTGFAESTLEAIRRYTTEYGIEAPGFPVLNPEFNNPLYLKLTCEALYTLGSNRFTFGSAGLLTVTGAFIEAVNRRLSAPDKCDFDETTNLVAETVRRLAQIGAGPYERAEARQITEELLPGRPWSQSLFLGMLREGVLIETYRNHVAFGYQRLGDVARASMLAEQPLADLVTWLKQLGDDFWQERSVVDTLAVIIPERFGVEIIDVLANEDRTVPNFAVDAFILSIQLRAPEGTTDRTAEIAEQLLGYEELRDRTWDALIRIACISNHALNASWHHKHLYEYALVERDVSWSEWLVGSTESPESAVGMLLRWTWRTDSADNLELSDEVASLATLILGWLLTSSDRRVRDRATKALVCVADRAPTGFALGLRQFRGCNDQYVIERLAAAACGAVLRTASSVAVVVIADATASLVADGWPTHLLTRDYLRRVSAAARLHGWDGPSWQPPYGADWPVNSPSAETIKAMSGPPEYRYSSVWGSIAGPLGDFGRYVLEPALRNIDCGDKEELQRVAERAIFARVIELGWTPDVFSDLDRGRHGGHDGTVERYGKKYQWIGLYEVLGRITDHFKLKDGWGDGEARDFAFPEEVIYRDTDPSVVVAKSKYAPEAPWFAPAAANFPADVVDEYPSDLEGIPDPLDLIEVVDGAGTKWLALIAHATWMQELPPEVAALRVPQLSAWIQIRGYLAPVADLSQMHEWAADKDWDGRWMPENADVYNRLLGAHPASPDWDEADGSSEQRGRPNDVIPAELVQCVAWYGGTGTSRDASAGGEATGYVPTRRLHDLLALGVGVDFQWRGSSEADPLAYDPSAQFEQASSFLLRRDLVDQLADAGYTLFWTVLLNKLRHDDDAGRPSDDYQWISASAAYALRNGQVGLISAVATRRRPGFGRQHPSIAWNLRRSG